MRRHRAVFHGRCVDRAAVVVEPGDGIGTSGAVVGRRVGDVAAHDRIDRLIPAYERVGVFRACRLGGRADVSGNAVAVVIGIGALEHRAVVIDKGHRTGLFLKVEAGVPVRASGGAEKNDSLFNVDGAVLDRGGDICAVGIIRVVRIGHHHLCDRRLGAVHRFLGVHPRMLIHLGVAGKRIRQRRIDGPEVEGIEIGARGRVSVFVLAGTGGLLIARFAVIAQIALMVIIRRRIAGAAVPDLVVPEAGRARIAHILTGLVIVVVVVIRKAVVGLDRVGHPYVPGCA